MIRRLLATIILCAVPVFAGPDDDFVEIYQLIQRTDAQREAGQWSEARNGYERAQEMLRALKKGYPQWNERVVAYRLRYVAEKLEQIPAANVAATETAGTSAAPAAAAEPANEVIAQFNALSSEIVSLRTEKQRLEAKLREALTAQPAPVDPKELQAAVERIAQLQATNQALTSRLETQQAERKNLVEKVLLDEAHQALSAANQQLASQREKTVELERLRHLAEGELKRLQDGELQGLKSENKTLKTQVEALQSETERGRQIANLTERLATLQEKLEQELKVNEALSRDRDKLAQELQDLRARQSEEEIVRLKQLETDLALARAESDRQAEVARQLEVRLASESGARVRLEGENKDLLARVEALTEQAAGIQTLQSQLTAEQEERVELEAQLQAAEERLSVLTASAVAPGGSGPVESESAASPAVDAPAVPDPALVAQIQILTAETARLRDVIRDGRTRQAELSALLDDARASMARMESEKRAMLKTIGELQATPTQRQLARSDRAIKSLEEKVRELEKERDRLASKLAEASDRSKSGIQYARRARLGNPKEDAVRFRMERQSK